jgi:hypothetical protein
MGCGNSHCFFFVFGEFLRGRGGVVCCLVLSHTADVVRHPSGQ